MNDIFGLKLNPFTGRMEYSTPGTSTGTGVGTGTGTGTLNPIYTTMPIKEGKASDISADKYADEYLESIGYVKSDYSSSDWDFLKNDQFNKQAKIMYSKTGVPPSGYDVPIREKNRLDFTARLNTEEPGHTQSQIITILNENDFKSYDEFLKKVREVDPYAYLQNEAQKKGLDPGKIKNLFDSGNYSANDLNELFKDYTISYGTPLERTRITAGQPAELPKFNTDTDKALMDAYVASLEDPFNTSTKTLLGNMAARGIVGSGIQQEGIGRLQTGYNNALSAEANTITNNTANQAITTAEQNYKTNVNNYLNEMETLFKSSGQTADEFYAKNQAMIDAQIQKYADQKEVDYTNAVSEHTSNMTDFQNTIDATNNLFSSIGSIGGSLISKNIPLSQAVNQNNNSGKQYGYNSMLNYPLISGLNNSSSGNMSNPWDSNLASGGLK